MPTGPWLADLWQWPAGSLSVETLGMQATGDSLRRVVVSIDWAEDHQHWHATIEGMPGTIFGETILRVRQAVLRALTVAAAEGDPSCHIEGDGGRAAFQAFGNGIQLDFRAAST